VVDLYLIFKQILMYLQDIPLSFLLLFFCTTVGAGGKFEVYRLCESTFPGTVIDLIATRSL
jgi:hypothetical protein